MPSAPETRLRAAFIASVRSPRSLPSVARSFPLANSTWVSVASSCAAHFSVATGSIFMRSPSKHAPCAC
ncbi:Uncharacterised protein [Mycobacteroides abscessus subsp. abscessus]|nr:Uncharacterised protein [Mycobacteroides abscessus subsp. abscessus]